MVFKWLIKLEEYDFETGRKYLGIDCQSLNKNLICMLLKLRKDFHAKCFGDDLRRLS